MRVTSVRDLSKFLRAYMNDGTYQGMQILKPETVQNMLSDKHFERRSGYPVEGGCLNTVNKATK